MMDPGFDITKLYSEAQNRWLKPSEVLFILQNHEKCVITPEPPNRPSSGSVFHFNRRVLRFFRNDGHVWRRKRDGRTVGEAHERLKVGNVDRLNCYYAHGEQNPYFQRRSYWMLDPAYDHIVLVHYREVSEGRCIPGSVPSLSSISSVTCNQSTNHANTQNQGTNDFSSFSPVSAEEVSSKSIVGNINRDFEAYDRMENSVNSSRPHVNQALRMLELQLSLDDDADGGDKLVLGEEKLPPNSTQEISQSSSHIEYECRKPALDLYGNIHNKSEYTEHYYFDKDIGGCDNSDTSIFLQGNCWKQLSQLSGSECMAERKSSISWKEMLEQTSSSSTGVATQSTLKTLTSESDPDSYAGTTCAIEKDFPAKDMRVHGNDMCLSSFEMGNLSISSCGSSEKLISQQTAYTENSLDNTYQDPESSSQIHLSAARRFLLGSDDTIELPTTAKQFQQTEDAIQYKAEGNICQDNSVGNVHWVQNMHSTGDRTICFSHCSDIPFKQRQHLAPFGADSSLTIAQKPLFSIREISPEWAFSSGNTKVVVTGDFFCNHSGYDWKVMFDDIEVPAQIIQEGVLRCQAPQHVAGRVSICVTYGNRVPCSEVREFEYRVKPDLSCLESGQQRPSAKTIDELLLLVRFGHFLLCGDNVTSIQNGENGPQTDIFSKLKATGDQWGHIIESLLVGSDDSPDAIDWLLQELFKDKLKQWSSSRSQDYESRGCSLSKREQSLIHIISALGYDWALSPILSVGVGVNFRDLNGWTALHWAAHFGREKMVAALLAAGASAGAVTDPTTQDLVGKNPASVAAASGHKGLAGYLSEVALTSHLTSLTMEGSVISKGSADLTAERAVESIYEKSIQVHEGATEDQLSLKDSLAAVRNAAQAAARIQSAFRAHSFRKKRLNADPSHDDYYLTPQDIHNLSVASKFFHGHRDPKFHIAALCIQRKYRGWRGRKNFLTLRQHVVKIQAHVRGHQVRKKYREFVWTVSVVEKVILRWRRRGAGLRGFKAESEPIDDIEADDILKVFRKQKVDAALDEAVSRVLSVVESREARQQYRRMIESYQLAKADLESAGEATSSARGDHDSGGTNQDMFDCTLDETWAHLNSSDAG